VGKIYYYPETNITDVSDSLVSGKGFRAEQHDQYILRDKKKRFGFNPLRDHSFLAPGDTYNEDAYFKTMITLGQIGTWQQVDGKVLIRDKDSVDLYFSWCLHPNKVLPSIWKAAEIPVISAQETCLASPPISHIKVEMFGNRPFNR